MVFLDPSRADLLLDRTRALLRGWPAFSATLAGLRAFAGPTAIASVAYLDPGNFATNITAGAMHGYRLLWVVLAANIMAMLFQALSAKLGIVSGRSLARLCRERLPRSLTPLLWIVSEIGAIATDLAELLGASIGCALLLGTSLLTGTLISAALSWAVLWLHGAELPDRRGDYRPADPYRGRLLYRRDGGNAARLGRRGLPCRCPRPSAAPAV